MRRVVAFLVLAAIVVAVAWWVAGLPGHVAAEFGTTTVQTTTPFAVLALAVLVVLLVVILRLLFGLLRLPRRLRRARAGRARRLGDEAVTGTLLALAAGESAEARRLSARSRRLLGDTPQTLLLAAESARRLGHEGEAESLYRTLTERDDARFLGLRGLLRQAIARQDWPAAAELAGRAEAAHPGSLWLRSERAQLAIRAGDWKQALALTGPDGPLAAVGTAAAAAEPDEDAALKLARHAFAADPTLAPAAIAYASRLRAAGRDGRAQDVIRRAWEAAPHPDLAGFALAPLTAPLPRLKAAEKLAQANPVSPESLLLVARTELEAGLIGAARRHAEAARDAGLNQRRVWMLLADIAEAEAPGSEAARDALRHAAAADPDPVWRCEACGTIHPVWHGACPVCHVAGRITWRAPAAAVLVAPESPPAQTPPQAQMPPLAAITEG